MAPPRNGATNRKPNEKAPLPRAKKGRARTRCSIESHDSDLPCRSNHIRSGRIDSCDSHRWPYDYPDLFVSVLEFCIAGFMAVILNYFSSGQGREK